MPPPYMKSHHVEVFLGAGTPELPWLFAPGAGALAVTMPFAFVPRPQTASLHFVQER